MVGYVEALTDPSYKGQILVLTSPMIGNYGVPNTDSRDDLGDPTSLNGLSSFLESEKIHVAGLIVTDYSADFSHWNANKALGRWLQESGVPALCGVDTRKLTKKIREFGSMMGRIDLGRDNSDAPPPVASSPLLSPTTSTASLSSLSLLPSPLPALTDLDAGPATHLVAQVTCKHIKVYGQGLHPRIIAFDCGMKNNIIRCFVKEQHVQVRT